VEKRSCGVESLIEILQKERRKSRDNTRTVRKKPGAAGDPALPSADSPHRDNAVEMRMTPAATRRQRRHQQSPEVGSIIATGGQFTVSVGRKRA